MCVWRGDFVIFFNAEMGVFLGLGEGVCGERFDGFWKRFFVAWGREDIFLS